MLSLKQRLVFYRVSLVTNLRSTSSRLVQRPTNSTDRSTFSRSMLMSRSLCTRSSCRSSPLLSRRDGRQDYRWRCLISVCVVQCANILARLEADRSSWSHLLMNMAESGCSVTIEQITLALKH